MPLFHSDPNIPAIRLSTAQLLAAAVCELFPNVVLVGGQLTNFGFYYDFIFNQPIDHMMLELLEVRMKGIIKENPELRTLTMMRENASALFNHQQQPFLAELALEEESNVLTLLQIGKFQGLCPEPHVEHLDEINGIKLLHVEKLEQPIESTDRPIYRITGTAFADPMALKQFLKAYEKLKKFDHRQLGQEMQLFAFSEKELDYFWFPKGELLRKIIIQMWEKQSQKIHPILAPILLENSLKRPYFHLEAFKLQTVLSDLPYRSSELFLAMDDTGIVGDSGLFNKETYLSDLVTIFCWEDQVDQEMIYSLQFFEQIITIFGFEIHWYLCLTKHKNHKGTALFKRILDGSSIVYTEVEEGLGQVPRIEGRLVDALGREWVGPSLSFIRLGEGRKTPMVLSRTLFSSIDRWVGLLIEKYKGEFPLWLAPEQIRILVLGEQNRSYAQQVYKQIECSGWRVDIDETNEKLGAKVHLAEKEKVPFLIMIGDNERMKERISIRSGNEHNRTALVELESFLESLRPEQSSWELKS